MSFNGKGSKLFLSSLIVRHFICDTNFVNVQKNPVSLMEGWKFPIFEEISPKFPGAAEHTLM